MDAIIGWLADDHHWLMVMVVALYMIGFIVTVILVTPSESSYDIGDDELLTVVMAIIWPVTLILYVIFTRREKLQEAQNMVAKAQAKR